MAGKWKSFGPVIYGQRFVRCFFFIHFVRSIDSFGTTASCWKLFVRTAQRRQCDAITVSRTDGTNEKKNTCKPREQYDKYAIKRLRYIPLIWLSAPCAVLIIWTHSPPRWLETALIMVALRKPANWFRNHKRVCGLFVTSTRARAG